MGRFKNSKKRNEEYKKVFFTFLCENELFFKFFEKKSISIEEIIHNTMKVHQRYTLEEAWFNLLSCMIFSRSKRNYWKHYFNNYLQQKNKRKQS